jgi:hypothetical protein
VPAKSSASAAAVAPTIVRYVTASTLKPKHTPYRLANTEFSGEPAALPSLVRCNSLFDGSETWSNYTRRCLVILAWRS